MRTYGPLYAVAVLAILASPLPSRAVPSNTAIVVIANKAVPVHALSRDDLRPIFQRRKKNWPDGSSVRPFNLPPSNSVRQKFDSAILGLDPEQMPLYWIDRRIRGGDRPPDNIPSAATMLKVVSLMPGAVGFIEAAAADDTVKVIARIVDAQVVPP
jgi:ABC-type phosphate transport system substrate-binding protein